MALALKADYGHINPDAFYFFDLDPGAEMPCLS
jgi:hypothetical protein